jgi:hypothetical protein
LDLNTNHLALYPGLLGFSISEKNHVDALIFTQENFSVVLFGKEIKNITLFEETNSVIEYKLFSLNKFYESFCFYSKNFFSVPNSEGNNFLTIDTFTQQYQGVVDESLYDSFTISYDIINSEESPSDFILSDGNLTLFARNAFGRQLYHTEKM